MKKLFLIALTALSFTANAVPKDSDLWSTLAQSPDDGTIYSILNGSGRITQNDDNVPIVAATGRMQKGNDKHSVQWYIPIEHCDQGQGVLVVTRLDGTYITNTQFALGLGTIAAVIAETMCNAIDILKSKQPQPEKKKQPEKKQNSNGQNIV